MINLSLFENLIQNANPKTTSENLIDEHFDQIVSFIEQEKIKEAAGLIEKVFAKNVPDIRLIIYYFYGHFTEHGIKSFIKTLPLAKSLINDHIIILTPKSRIDKHIQSSLNWFFSHILQRFKYYEKLHNAGKSHPVWKKSLLETSLEELDQLSQISKDFNQFFSTNWPLSPTKERILHLIKKLEDIRKIVAESQKPNPEEIIETHEEIEEEKEDVNTDQVLNSDESEVAPISQNQEKDHEIISVETNVERHEIIPIEPTPEQPAHLEIENTSNVQPAENSNEEVTQKQTEIESSIPASLSILSKVDKEAISEPLHLFIESLDHLSRKLKIFEAFIEKGDYLKAAVVAKDIDYLIENFDPLSYFPKLFAKYFSIFAKHVTALTEQYEKKDTLQVRALVNLYKTDLQMFLDW